MVKAVKVIKKLFILFQRMSIYTNNIIPPVGKTSLQLLVPIPQAICSEQIHSLPLPCSKEEHQELSVAGDPYLKQSPETHIKIARQLHKASSKPCEQRMQENFFYQKKKDYTYHLKRQINIFSVSLVILSRNAEIELI